MKRLLLAAFLVACSDGEPTFQTKDASADVEIDSDPDSSLQIIDASVEGGFDFIAPSKGIMHYKGGPVMTNSIHAYYIWYGDWNNSGTVPILEDLMNDIGSSDYFQINTDYFQQSLDAGLDGEAPRIYVSSKVSLTKEVFIDYTHGKKLSDADVQSIVSDQILNGSLPTDPDGIYFVITDKTVDQYLGISSFCGGFCGWHYNGTINGVDIKYSFIGDTEKCPNDCSAKGSYYGAGYPRSPNGDWSADGMASVLIHELEEAATDPDLNAWLDITSNYENADECAWTYGKLYVTNNNSVANVKVGNRDYLIQQNWKLYSDAGHCDMKR